MILNLLEEKGKSKPYCPASDVIFWIKSECLRLYKEEEEAHTHCRVGIYVNY